MSNTLARAERRRGVLERSLENLTIGVAAGQRARDRNLRDTYTGEWEQQVHVPIDGEAIDGWGFVDSPVRFELPLMAARSQRMSDFTTPHFTHGVELVAATERFVRFEIQVAQWTTNEFGWIVGATMRFGVSAPGVLTPDFVPYSAIVHMSFQGYGGLAEGDEFST